MGVGAWASNDGPELPLEQAMAELDKIAPLPNVDPSFVHDTISLLLPGDEAPNYLFLKYLQDQEEIAVKKQEEEEKFKIDIEEFLTKSRQSYIHDPLAILTAPEEMVLTDFLVNYGLEASNKIYINLLTKDEVSTIAELSESRYEALLKSDPTGILIFYFYEEPSRTYVYFSKVVRQSIPYKVLEKFQKSALDEALKQNDSYHAIYRHLLDLTLNLTTYHEAKSLQLLNQVPIETARTGGEESQEAGAEKSVDAGGTAKVTEQEPQVEALPAHTIEAGEGAESVESGATFFERFDFEEPEWLQVLTREENTTTIIMWYFAAIILATVVVALMYIYRKRRYHFPLLDQEPFLNFMIAKDTSISKSFQAQPQKSAESDPQ